jgi:hypothetical protein
MIKLGPLHGLSAADRTRGATVVPIRVALRKLEARQIV